MAKTYPKPETTIEFCPHCGNEVEILAKKKSPCPVCGRVILPCSTCMDVIEGPMPCDWTKEEGCWRFPK